MQPCHRYSVCKPVSYGIIISGPAVAGIGAILRKFLRSVRRREISIKKL